MLNMDAENFTQKSTLIVTLHKVEHVTGMSEQGCKYLDYVYVEFMILGLLNDQASKCIQVVDINIYIY